MTRANSLRKLQIASSQKGETIKSLKSTVPSSKILGVALFSKRYYVKYLRDFNRNLIS